MKNQIFLVVIIVANLFFVNVFLCFISIKHKFYMNSAC